MKRVKEFFRRSNSGLAPNTDLMLTALIAPLGYLLQFCLTVLVARAISTEEFGYYSFVLQVANFVAVVIGCGLPIYCQKLLPELVVRHDKNGISAYLSMVVVFVLIFVLVFVFFVFFVSMADGDFIYILVALAALTTVVWQTQLYACLGFGRIVLGVSPRDILFPIVFMLLLALIQPKDSVTTLFVHCGVLLSIVSISFILVLRLEKIQLCGSRIQLPIVKGWFKNSLPLAVTSLTQFGVYSMDLIILGILAPLPIVGIYAACTRVAMLINMLTRVAIIASGHRLSELKARNEYKKFLVIYKKSMALCVVFGFIFLVFVLMFGRDVLSFFGDEYSDYYFTLVLLTIGYYLSNAVGPVATAHNMLGNQIYMAKSQVFWIGLSVSAYFLVIPLYAHIGAAVVTAITQVLMRWRQAYVLFRDINVQLKACNGVKL